MPIQLSRSFNQTPKDVRGDCDEKGHSSAVPRTHYRPEIDGLRACAVILVFAFHSLPTAVPGVAGIPAAAVFEQDSIFCDVTTCSVMHAGLPLLRDNGHYSIYGGDLAMSAFAATMDQSAPGTIDTGRN